MTIGWLPDLLTHDLDRALHYTTLWGMDAVVLRAMGEEARRVPHLDEEKLVRRLEESEIKLAGVWPDLLLGRVEERAEWMNDLITLGEVVDFCERLGCPRIFVLPFASEARFDAERLAEPLKRAAEVVADRPVRLCLMNDSQTTVATGAQLAELIEAVDHPAVRALWHPAEAVRAGEDPMTGVETIEPYVDAVRCADLDGIGGWSPAPIGEGEVELFGQLEYLSYAGFDGLLDLQVDVEPKPKYGLRATMRLYEMVRTIEGRDEYAGDTET